MSGAGYMMTARERIEAALHGEWADRVPLSIYWNMLPRGDAERCLRNEGWAVVEWIRPYRVEMPHVEVWAREFYRDGVLNRREVVRTPVGEVSSVLQRDRGYGTSWWRVEHYVKRPEDYGVLEYMIRDTHYVPDYDGMRLAQERWGEDGYIFCQVLNVPMHHMMYELMGIERFSLDLHERPDDFFRLHDLLWDRHREAFGIAADSPAEYVVCGSNFHQDMIGASRFEQYYIPYLDEFADCLHGAGKLAGCHLDAPMRKLLDAVAGSRIDVVEALTPPPTCDVTVAEARTALPDKVLWINFPSSAHVFTREEIQAQTDRILREAAPGDRFLIGVTEDIPEGAWRNSLRVISRVIADKGALPLVAADRAATVSGGRSGTDSRSDSS
jgi:hypothetical protein